MNLDSVANILVAGTHTRLDRFRRLSLPFLQQTALFVDERYRLAPDRAPRPAQLEEIAALVSASALAACLSSDPAATADTVRDAARAAAADAVNAVMGRTT